MKTPDYSFFIAIMISAILLLPGCTSRQKLVFPEMTDPRLEEIALLRIYRFNGMMVVYNPETCERLGDACRFFRLQAYAHYRLDNMALAEPDDYTANQRRRADCWAAQGLTPVELESTLRFLRDTGKHEGLRIYGDPEQRADVIEQCARQTNVAAYTSD